MAATFKSSLQNLSPLLTRARIHEQYLDKVTLDLSKGRFFT